MSILKVFWNAPTELQLLSYPMPCHTIYGLAICASYLEHITEGVSWMARRTLLWMKNRNWQTLWVFGWQHSTLLLRFLATSGRVCSSFVSFMAWIDAMSKSSLLSCCCLPLGKKQNSTTLATAGSIFLMRSSTHVADINTLLLMLLWLLLLVGVAIDVACCCFTTSLCPCPHLRTLSTTTDYDFDFFDYNISIFISFDIAFSVKCINLFKFFNEVCIWFCAAFMAWLEYWSDCGVSVLLCFSKVLRSIAKGFCNLMLGSAIT